MGTKSWTNLGQITVNAYNGALRTFPTLEAAVLCVGKHHIDQLTDRPLGHLSILTRLHPHASNLTWNYALSSGSYAAFGETLVFVDELGMHIPSWKVREAFYGVPVEARTYRWRRPIRFDFRNGPVPGTWKRRRRYVHDRSPKTSAEYRSSEAYMRDLAELDVRPKGRVRLNLPTVYDDIPRARGWGTKSWKEFRKTQYKVG